MKKIFLLVLAPVFLLVSAETLFAGGKYQQGAAKGQQGVIFGQELMTKDEMAEHQAHIMKLKTDKEREEYRQEHHALMRQRAEERGVSIADVPQGRGRALNPESGSGVELGNLPEE